MLLHREASRILHLVQEKRGSVKNIVLTSKYPNKKALMALVCQTMRYKSVLDTIIEKTKLYKHAKILKQESLAHILLYEFLIGKGFIGKTDVFKEAVLKHKAALQSEFARLKVQAGTENNEDLLPSDLKNEVFLPRYVRINTLKRNINDVIEEFRKDNYRQILKSSSTYENFIVAVGQLKKDEFIQDPHIEELLIFSAESDLHDNDLYKAGDIIFQDKASCIPPFLLCPPPGSQVIDCCAAPGNKTSQLAAYMHNTGKLFAFDKDQKRAATLNTLLLRAGVLCVNCKISDFLLIDPDDPQYRDVQYILVDPSCSGSGMVNRHDNVTNDDNSDSDERLAMLSKFQLSILIHAMSFPGVEKLVYSTCSTHQIENERVVSEALRLTAGHYKLASILKEFPNRGQSFEGAAENFKAKRCLRLSPSTDLTNGFFVAMFKRHNIEGQNLRSVLSEAIEREPETFFIPQTGLQPHKRKHTEQKNSIPNKMQKFAENGQGREVKHSKDKESLKQTNSHQTENECVKAQSVPKKIKKKLEKKNSQTVVVNRPNIVTNQTNKKKKKNRKKKHRPVTA